MGTYDTRGGTPISPDVPDSVPSQLEADVLEVLEQLDVARANARAVLGEVFMRLVQHRYPVGTRVALNQVALLYGHPRNATHLQVTRVRSTGVDLDRPETSRVTVECVTLRKDGSPTENVVGFDEHVLGNRRMQALFDAHPIPERDQLVKLIAELVVAPDEISEADHSGPSPE